MKNQKVLEISIKNAVFNCRIAGKGERNVICFHGFGQDGRIFQPLVKYKPGCTFYAFDLPFHGDTKIQNPDDYLTAREIQQLVQELLHIADIGKFSIIAFSIGAKLAFPIMEAFGPKVEHVWLLAPDGILNNLWYKFAIGSKFKREIFRFLMKNPQVMFLAAKLLKSTHLIGSDAYNLIKKSIATSDKREQVFNTWTYLRDINYKIEKLSSIAIKNDFQIEIIVGDNDKIIHKKKLEKEAKGIKGVSLYSLEAGHQDLIKKFAEQRLINL